MKVIFEDTFQKIVFGYIIYHFVVVTLTLLGQKCSPLNEYVSHIYVCHIVMLLSPCLGSGIRIITELFQILLCIDLSPRLAKSSSMNLQLILSKLVTTSSQARCNIALEKFIVECSRARVGKCCWRRRTHSSLNKNGDHVHHSNGRTHMHTVHRWAVVLSCAPRLGKKIIAEQHRGLTSSSSLFLAATVNRFFRGSPR